MVLSAAVQIILTASLMAEGEAPGKGIDANIAYNPGTSTVIQCTVKKVFFINWPHNEGASEGLCLTAERGNTLYTVIVAPLWHVGSYMHFKPGDPLSISGSLRISGRKKILVARWIKKEGRTLHLRTMAGIPHWESNGPVMKKRIKGRKGRGKGRKGGRGM